MNLSDLHPVDPYLGFDHTRYPFEVVGWGSTSPLFEQLIKEIRPGLIIEVGSHLGMSAIHMAGLLKENGLGGSLIICVDTWLGQWYWRDGVFPHQSLRHGRPDTYERFLANVMHAGHQDVIVPFPMTSSAAAEWLKKAGIVADLVYLDGSHAMDDVSGDIRAFLPLCRSVLFGDDFHPAHPGVVVAVKGAFGSDVETADGRFWVVRPAENTRSIQRGARSGNES